MIVSFCGIVADRPVPGFDLSVIQRISNENGFRGVAVQLFKLLGMAVGQEEELWKGAIKAAGQLCDFTSSRRAECLEGMSIIASGGTVAKAVVARACAAPARLQGTVVGPAEGGLDLSANNYSNLIGHPVRVPACPAVHMQAVIGRACVACIPRTQA